MKTKYKIEKNIPIPSKRGGYKYPFQQMKVGDSFIVSLSEGRVARSTLSSFGARLKMKFCSRKVEEGVRIWRIK